jgi:DNA-binding transcriptional LysR family regulator
LRGSAFLLPETRSIAPPDYRTRPGCAFAFRDEHRLCGEHVAPLGGWLGDIRLESRSPHTLLVLAEAQHGVAIISSTFRAHRYNLKIVRIVYRGRPLREPLAVLWDKRRPLPRYGTAFRQMWAEHVRAVFPITRPTEPMAGATPKQAKGRRARATRDPLTFRRPATAAWGQTEKNSM